MTIHRRHNHGNVLLAIVCIVAAGAVLYFGYKIIKSLKDHPFDPNHGQGTNVMDSFMASDLTGFQAQYPDASVIVAGSGTVMPLTSLTQNWYYMVQTGTNLVDWEDTSLDWPTAMEQVRTNHGESARWYRQLLITY